MTHGKRKYLQTTCIISISKYTENTLTTPIKQQKEQLQIKIFLIKGGTEGIRVQHH